MNKSYRSLFISLLLSFSFFSVTLATLYASTRTISTTQTVVINEIAWMGTQESSNDEWIELLNTTDSAINISGWSLFAEDGTPTIALNGTIPANGYFLLERTDDNSAPGVVADQIYTGALGNTGEKLILQDDSSILVDEVDSSAGWFAGHADARVPMLRVFPTISGSLLSNWTYNPRCGSATNSSGISRTCTLTETTLAYDLDYQVYFNDLATTATNISYDVTPMEQALVDLIDNATSTIDVALYGLNRQRIIDTLINAHNRSVQVRIVGDDEAKNVDYAAGYQALSDAGITIVTDSSTSKIEHNKFFVFDGQIVWTGSTNLTDTGFTYNANNSIVITDTVLASIYTAEFEEMWVGTFNDSKSDNTAHLLDYDGTHVETYFSPTDIVAFEVWNELAQADDSIHFAMFFFTDDVLANQLVNRIEDGIEVYGVWDQLGAANVGSDDEQLCAAGAHIATENFLGKLHHKFAVIDVNGDDPTVILGSYNWTDSGAYDNDENTLIIHDRDLAEAYYQEWQSIWSAIDLERICNPPTIYLPMVTR